MQYPFCFYIEGLTGTAYVDIMYWYNKYNLEKGVKRRERCSRTERQRSFRLMDIIISNNANKPIYEQITSQIKAMIMRGELKTGDSIPSMRSLAKSIHVSVITVQKAYEDLQREGFIETTVGRGSFVSANNKEFYQEQQQILAEEHLQAAAEIGRNSNIPLEKLTELLAMFYQESC